MTTPDTVFCRPFEDDAATSHLLRIVLESDGHEVLIADDGSRGFATARRRSPDAILLDVMMPHLDGFSVLEALHEDERTATIPVIVLTALQTDSVEERCYRMGAQSFIRKLFDAGILLGTIQEVLDGPPPLTTERVAHEPGEVPLAVTLAWQAAAGTD